MSHRERERERTNETDKGAERKTKIEVNIESESTNFSYENECVQIFIWFYLFMCLRPSTKLLYINCNCNPVSVYERDMCVCVRATRSSAVTLVFYRSIPILKRIQTWARKKLGTFAKKKEKNNIHIHYHTYIANVTEYTYNGATFNSLCTRHFGIYILFPFIEMAMGLCSMAFKEMEMSPLDLWQTYPYFFLYFNFRLGFWLLAYSSSAYTHGERERDTHTSSSWHPFENLSLQRRSVVRSRLLAFTRISLKSNKHPHT